MITLKEKNGEKKPKKEKHVSVINMKSLKLKIIKIKDNSLFYK